MIQPTHTRISAGLASAKTTAAREVELLLDRQRPVVPERHRLVPERSGEVRGERPERTTGWRR